jgi:hypothetical protein
MEQINVAGDKIFHIVLDLAKWVALVAGSGAIIQSISKKDVPGAVKQALSYGVGYAALYLLQWSINLVREVFA